MCVGTVGVALSSPRYLVAAFNPVSLNLAIACLALLDVMVLNYMNHETRADFTNC